MDQRVIESTVLPKTPFVICEHFRYTEFKCITRVLTWQATSEAENGRLLVVPCSRSDVFTSNAVTLIEKRLLMKFLEFCHSYDQHPDQLEGKT